MSPREGQFIVSEGNTEGAEIRFRSMRPPFRGNGVRQDFVERLRRSRAPASESRSRAQTMASTVLELLTLGVVMTVANDSAQIPLNSRPSVIRSADTASTVLGS